MILILTIIKISKYLFVYINILILKRDEDLPEGNKSKEDDINKNTFKMLFENDKNSKKW